MINLIKQESIVISPCGVLVKIALVPGRSSGIIIITIALSSCGRGPGRQCRQLEA